MLLTPQGYDFAQLVLKHYRKTLPKEEHHEGEHHHHHDQKHEHHHHHHHSHEETEVQSEPVQKDNKEKYSLDYSKWKDFGEDQNKEAMKEPTEQEYKNMFGCFHDRRKERQLYEKTTKEKLEAAEFFKKEGNKQFQKKDYAKADIEYQKALIQFDYTFPDTEQEEKEVGKLQEQCHTNLALVKFYLKDFKECIFQCELAIKINKTALKPRYRKACALLELDDYPKVEQEIKTGLELDPESKDFSDLKKKLDEKIKQYEQKNQKVYKRIFESS